MRASAPVEDVAAVDQRGRQRDRRQRRAGCWGLPDYMVRVGTPYLDTFEAFVTAGLGAVPGIARIDSHLTMKVVKSPDRRAQPSR